MAVLKCPICRKPVGLQDPLVPFCSERCKLIDLGNWASGSYVISTPLKPGEMPSPDRESGGGEEEEIERD
jgi:uncharacterized protein